MCTWLTRLSPSASIDPNLVPHHLQPFVTPSVRKLHLEYTVPVPTTKDATTSNAEYERLLAENASLKTCCFIWRKRAAVHASATLGLVGLARIARDYALRMKKERDEFETRYNELKKQYDEQMCVLSPESVPCSSLIATRCPDLNCKRLLKRLLRRVVLSYARTHLPLYTSRIYQNSALNRWRRTLRPVSNGRHRRLVLCRLRSSACPPPRCRTRATTPTAQIVPKRSGNVARSRTRARRTPQNARLSGRTRPPQTSSRPLPPLPPRRPGGVSRVIWKERSRSESSCSRLSCIIMLHCCALTSCTTMDTSSPIIPAVSRYLPVMVLDTIYHHSALFACPCVLLCILVRSPTVDIHTRNRSMEIEWPSVPSVPSCLSLTIS